MTPSNVELLPLPEMEQLANPYAHVFGSVTAYGHTDETLTTYTRANVEHHTAAKDAEIEALRAEVERLKQMLGDCYVEAGADTDGNEPSRMYAQALSAVQDLRRDYDETLAEPEYKARADRLAKAAEKVLVAASARNVLAMFQAAEALGAALLHPTDAQEDKNDGQG